MDDGQSEAETSKRVSSVQESASEKRKPTETPSSEQNITISSPAAGKSMVNLVWVLADSCLRHFVGANEPREHQYDNQQYGSQQQFSSSYQLSSTSWNNQQYPANNVNQASRKCT